MTVRVCNDSQYIRSQLYWEFRDPVRALLRRLADMFFERNGLRFELYGASVHDEDSVELLIAPGFG
jgi:hypothetical protein